MKYLLTLNAGSSSLKYALYTTGLELVKKGETSLDDLPSLFTESVSAIGHRIVHGGKKYTKSTKIDAKLIQELSKLKELAPLHNGLAVQVIEKCVAHYGDTLFQLAVFDTTFFRNMPDLSRYYAISKKYEIERFGFHGIAHESLWNAYVEKTGKKEAKIITLQLGSGSSIAAIENGNPIDTSMGYTPNEGLVMATRSGDIDPQVVVELAKTMPLADAMDILNRESGLLGLSGTTSRMQELIEENPNQFAIELYCYRCIKYIGAYIAALKGVDAIIFSGGIGENSPLIRQKILDALSWHTFEVFVIPSDENRFIARELRGQLG